ncbi:Ig-like domain-containing protein [Ekhidna sp.]|uniref:Ig-like domain-containing protein n=1 Tax=Ekhidna sp. TaxID=2608089 RepID=UPI003CCC2A72
MKTLNTTDQDHRRLKQKLWIIEALIFIASLFLVHASEAQNVTIPDTNFKSYLLGNTSINTNMDTEIQVSEATAYTGVITCNNLTISDLTGIEAFINITELNASQNALTNVDLSQNTAIRILYLSFNDLTSIDLSDLVGLEELYINRNDLTSLDLSSNTSLLKLEVDYNPLSSLDLSMNTALEWLSVRGVTSLSSLDVSSNTALHTIYISESNFTSIDLSQNTQLEYLFANSNSLTSLDVSANTMLKELHLWGNDLTSLDVTNNVNLLELGCANNSGITSLNISQNTALIDLDASETGITTIDLSNNTLLETVSITDNNLSSIDVTALTALEELYVYSTLIESIDLSQNTNLQYLDIEYNQLEEIDISNNTVLVEAILNGNSPLRHLNAANGNNENLYLEVDTSPNLECIQVSNVDYANANWGKDETASFSLDCPGPFELVSLTPGDNSTNASKESVLTLTFTHDAAIGAGNIRVYKVSNDDLVAQLNNFNGTYMTIDGPSITFDFPVDFPQGEELYVQVSDAYLRSDEISEDWEGIQDDRSWTFTVEDTRPQIVSFSPTSEIIPANVELSITYDRNMALTTSSIPAIRIYNSDDTQVFFANKNSPYISLDGAIATISLPNPLASGTDYYVTLGEGLFVDAEDIANGGEDIDDDETWTFSTRANDGNGPDIVSLSPANGATKVERAGNAIDFEITFDEPVYLGNPNGAVKLYREAGETDVLYYNIGANASISEDNLTVTFNLPGNYTMQENTEYYILLDATNGSSQVIFDADGNNVTAIDGENDWRFTTYGAVEILSTVPSDDAVDVSTSGVVSFTTNNYITVATGAPIYLKYASNNANASVVTTDSEEVTLNGKEVTIDFGELNTNTSYYVYIPNSAFRDEFNQTFTITGADTWNFTTGDEVPPSVVTLSPSHQSTDVAADADLVLTFNEDVQLSGEGLFKMYDRSNDQQIGTIWSFDGGASVVDNEVTYDIPIDLPYGTEVYFEITNAIEDLAGNRAENITGSDDWYFTVEGELDPPQITSLSPTNGATDVSITSNLVLTFNEEVQLTGAGTFKMFNKVTGEQIGPNWFFPGGATVDDNMVTYDIPIDLPYETEIYFTITNAIEDVWGNAAENITGDADWVITTELAPDEIAPVMTSLNPSDNSLNVSLDEDLEITFDEPIVGSADGGFVRVKKVSNGAQILGGRPAFEEDQFSIDGNVLTIHLSEYTNQAPEYETEYYVTIQNNAIEDLAGNKFAGFDDTMTWTFTTEAAPDETAPVITSLNPTDDATNIAVDEALTITFDEDIMIATSGATKQAIIKFGSNQNFEVVPLTADNIDGNVLSIPHQDFDRESSYYIYLADGVIADLSNNWFSGIIESTEWNFTTESKLDQTITFSEIEDKVFGDDSFQLEASSSSDLDVLFTVVDGPISLDGNTVTITGAGTATITANQTGDDTYNPAQEVTQTFEIDKANQLITITPIDDKLIDYSPFEIDAEVDSGLELTYSVSGPATNEGATVSLTGETGSVTITVSQAGNVNYKSTSASVSFEVTDPSKQNQTITFAEIGNKVFGDDPFQISASSSSGLDVLLTIVEGPISLNGNTVTITGAGTATIAANQAGDDTFNPASEVIQSFVIVKADQVITITPIEDKLTTDAAFDIVAEIDSELDLTYEVSGPATIAGTTITLDGNVGTVTVTVSQTGNDNYNSASASESFDVTDPSKQDQTITFSEITDKVFGDDPFQLSASSTSDLDVTFSVVSGPVSLNGIEVTITGAGTAVIAANQAGDDTYNPAQEVTQTFEIAKADQVITINPIEDKLTTDAAFDIVAEVDSELDLTYEVSGPATIAGTTITLDGNVGTVIVNVSQTGNDNYNSASASESFDVTDPSKQDQTITFSEIADKVFGDDPFQLSASSTSGLDVTFSVVSGPVSLNGIEVTITGAGTAVIAANQAGDDTYNPAQEVTQTFEVAKADQVITITPIEDKLTTDAAFDIVAEVDSELDLTYEVSGPATIAGTTITLDGNVGTVTVTVSQTGNENFNAASESTSFEVEEAVLSANPGPQINIYPNPVIDYLTIESNNTSRMRLVNLNGQVMIEKEMSYGILNLSDLKAGVYVLEVVSNDTITRRRIVKAN